MLLEMHALNSDGGVLYLSWTPIGMNVFKVSRNKMLEARLVEYLSQFVKSAIDPMEVFAYRNKCQEPIASQITMEIKNIAKSTEPLAQWQSVTDKGAQLATRRIVSKIDGKV